MATSRNRGKGGGLRASAARQPRGAQDAPGILARIIPGPIASSRMAFVLILFVLVAIFFLGRLLYLQLVVAGEYSEAALQTRQLALEIAPKRGTIYDRNGNVLATSVDAVSVVCNPLQIDDPQGVSKQLVEILGGKASDYLEILTTPDSGYAFLKRQADASVKDKIDALGVEGLYCEPDVKRVYPNGVTGAQIIGVVDTEGVGQSGLELQYDDILSGSPGELTVEYGQTGIPIVGTERRTQPQAGQDITVSLDLDLQQKVEETITNGAKDMKAASGRSVVMDAETGEILACASTPLLDPDNRAELDPIMMEAQCITRAFEPGSIFKSVTMMAALEEGAVRPNDSLYCPSELRADDRVVSDAHARGSETMTMEDIIAFSSNVGISLVAERMGFDTFYKKIGDYGLDMEFTGVDYPAEGSGYLTPQPDWQLIQAYNVSFGQGVTVTPIQMTRFYGALANNGVAATPHFLIRNNQTGEEPAWETKQIIDSPEGLSALTKMLVSVSEWGTALDAQIEGFDVAGKTGTAEYVDEEHPEQGYLVGKYHSSFVGFLPNTNNKLVCFVGATEVPSERGTSDWFQDIMSFAIERYNINPTQG